jgi:hypothetical protein
VKAAFPLALFAALSFAAPASSAETLSQYQAVVDAARNQLQAAAKGGDVEGTLRAVAQRLQRIGSVQLPSGEQVKVDNSVLLTQVESGGAAGYEAAIRKLDSLSQALSLYSRSERAAALGPSPEQAAVAADRVLQRREFRRSVLERGRFDLVRALMRVVERIFSAAGKAAGVVGWLVLALSALGFVAMTVSHVLRLVRSRPAPERGSAAAPLLIGGTEPISQDDTLANAERAAKSGDYRNALRSLYQGMLLLLSGLGLIRYEKATTNWEYVRAVRATDVEAEKILAAATLLFERRWYGLAPATAVDYSLLMDNYDALRHAAQTRRPRQ